VVREKGFRGQNDSYLAFGTAIGGLFAGRAEETGRSLALQTVSGCVFALTLLLLLLLLLMLLLLMLLLLLLLMLLLLLLLLLMLVLQFEEMLLVCQRRSLLLRLLLLGPLHNGDGGLLVGRPVVAARTEPHSLLCRRN